MNYIVNTDGASRGNPGRAAYGFVIRTIDGVIIHQEGNTIGIETNNVAEYIAVLRSLSYLNSHLVKNKVEAEIITDSLLIASQLSGKYKVKNEVLKKIYQKIKDLEVKIGKVKYKHVQRKENYLADRLANLALDKR